MPETIEILVYGLGAVGGLYAYILSCSPSVRLTIVARSNYTAIKENGIRLDSTVHGSQILRPYSVIQSLSESKGKFNYIVFAHKALGSDSVPKELPSVMTPETSIVIMQNGVGNEESFRQLLPETTMITSSLWISAHQHTPGIITHTASVKTPLGLYSRSSSPSEIDESRLAIFASLLEKGGMPTPVFSPEEMQIQKWEKLAWNAAFNSFTALTGLNTQTWLSSSSTAIPITKRLMREIIAVARAEGVYVREDLHDILVEQVLRLPAIKSSMQVDIGMGRPLEVDAIFGTVIGKAGVRGVEVPTLEVVCALLRGINSRIGEDQAV